MYWRRRHQRRHRAAVAALAIIAGITGAVSNAGRIAGALPTPPNCRESIAPSGSRVLGVTPDGRFATISTDTMVRKVDRTTGTAVDVVPVAALNPYQWIEAMTPDGRFLLFGSAVANVTPDDGNNRWDWFLADTASHTLERVNGPGGAHFTYELGLPTLQWAAGISDDGRYVVYSADLDQVTGGSVAPRVYVADRTAGTRTLIAEGATPGISGNGRYLTYVVGQASDGTDRTMLADRSTATTVELSRGGGDRWTDRPVFTAGGTAVAFVTTGPLDATDAIDDPPGGDHDTYVTNLTNATSTWLHGFAGQAASAEPQRPTSFSADGRYLSTQTDVVDLVERRADSLGAYSLLRPPNVVIGDGPYTAINGEVVRPGRTRGQIAQDGFWPPGVSGSFDVSGFGLRPGAMVDLGPGVSANLRWSGASVDLDVSIAATAAPGERQVVVTGPDGCRDVAASFRIDPPLAIGEAFPSAVGNGVTPVLLRGDSLGDHVTIEVVPGDDITVTQELGPAFRIEVRPEARRGPRTLRVTDSRGPVAERTDALLITDDVGTFQPITPVRVLDTRFGWGVANQPVFSGQQVVVAPTGALNDTIGVGNRLASSAVFNVTITGAIGGGFVTVYPAGEARPWASTLNFAAGETTSNLVISRLGADGRVAIYVEGGVVEVIVDTVGWFSRDSASGQVDVRGSFVPMSPTRAYDSRSSRLGRLSAGYTRTLQLFREYAGVSAVAFNLTVTDPGDGGFVVVHPGGTEPPWASNINFGPGETTSRHVISGIAENGTIAISTPVDVHFVIDLTGFWVTGREFRADGRLVGVSPARLLDTRLGGTRVNLGESVVPGVLTLTVGGRGGVPADAQAVVLNVTVTKSAGWSYLSVWPAGRPQPLVSHLTYPAGATVANMVVVPLGSDGRINLADALGRADVVVDVVGYFR